MLPLPNDTMKGYESMHDQGGVKTLIWDGPSDCYWQSGVFYWEISAWLWNQMDISLDSHETLVWLQGLLAKVPWLCMVCKRLRERDLHSCVPQLSVNCHLCASNKLEWEIKVFLGVSWNSNLMHRIWACSYISCPDICMGLGQKNDKTLRPR